MTVGSWAWISGRFRGSPAWRGGRDSSEKTAMKQLGDGCSRLADCLCGPMHGKWLGRIAAVDLFREVRLQSKDCMRADMTEGLVVSWGPRRRSKAGFRREAALQCLRLPSQALE